MLAGGGVPTLRRRPRRRGVRAADRADRARPQDARTNREEIFGPVCRLLPVRHRGGGVRAGQRQRLRPGGDGLDPRRRAGRTGPAPRLDAGIVWVNTWFLRDLRTPFGGVKASGIGREGGVHSLALLLRTDQRLRGAVVTDVTTTARRMQAAADDRRLRAAGKPLRAAAGAAAAGRATSTPAYAVQQAIDRALAVAAGRRIVGAKIGLTIPAVQSQLGVVPARLRRAVRRHGRRRRRPRSTVDRLLQPRVEAEVAFVLGRDLPHEQVTVADVIRAIDYAAARDRDRRLADRRTGTSPSWTPSPTTPPAALFVLGTTPASRSADVDLRLCGMVLEHARRAGLGRRGRGLPRQPAATRWPGWPQTHGRARAPAARRATWCCPARSARWSRSTPGRGVRGADLRARLGAAPRFSSDRRQRDMSGTGPVWRSSARATSAPT